MTRRRALFAPAVLTGLGLAIFFASLFHHFGEVSTIEEVLGPLAAFTLDGVPALLLVYGSYWLAGSDFSARQRTRVVAAAYLGGLLFTGTVAASVYIRVAEGRMVSEPAFALLLAATVGTISGFVVGYYSARATRKANRATRATNTLSFTNSILRHDIKNNMTVIRGHAQHLLETDHDPAVVDAAETISGQVDEALETIDRTGAIAAALSREDFETVDLVPVVREVVDSVEDAHGVTISVDLPESAPIHANDAVRSVVHNLVENAVQHADTDDPEITVTVTVRGGTVRLRVSDDGPGIPEGEKATLFAPDDDPGGLQIVGTLVTCFDGSVRVTDNDPRGTVFTVDLSRARD